MPSLYNEFLRHLPERYGARLRAEYLRRGKADAWGHDASIGRGCRILRPENLRVAHGVRIARDVTLDARGGLTIDRDALIGFESILLTYTHNADQIGVPVQHQGFWSAPVTIGARAWLGMRVMILPGVTIGEDAIVASGAVVTKDVAPRMVVAGVPADVLRERATSG
jgi:acetyltransferase-like isoleucine patch superfamily enzyme